MAIKRKTKHIIIPDEVLINKIYILRGQKIILDRDLADLYGVKAIRLREQVSRNLSRFPVKFMFQLTERETDLMVSQNLHSGRCSLRLNRNERR
jgi:hypothetical protein